jgi:hypothetical protein
MSWKISLIVWLFLLTAHVFPQKNYFYFGRDYGSDAVFNPINTILNGSFDIMQLEDHKREPFTFPYKGSWNNLWRNIRDPFHSIRIYGTRNFIKDEVFPLELKTQSAQWWPNYQLHLIGGGMTYIALREWYELHDFPMPMLCALTTTAAYHLLNETVEMNNYQGITVDPISDIYLFDLGGIFLFSNDRVKEFFSSTLNLRDWSLQPTISLNDGHLHNNGQYFEIKWFTPWSDRYALFYYFGINGLTGISYKYDEEYSVSGGAGLRARRNESVDASVGKQTVSTVWNTGLFIDRNNSLLVSFFLSGLSDYTALLNIYPGVIHVGHMHFGCWVAASRQGKLTMGVNLLSLPGIGYSQFR